MLTAVVVIGRVGARITAELGTMQVSEQIDALYSLGRDPVTVLAAPRILAGHAADDPCWWASPTLVGVLAGHAGRPPHRGPRAMRPSSTARGSSGTATTSSTREMKAWTFGFIIPLISVHMGLLTRGGAEGVGRVTTASVVFMIIAVLVRGRHLPAAFLN